MSVHNLMRDGDVRDVLIHFQRTFVNLIANAKSQAEANDLSEAFARLIHLVALSLGATLNEPDDVCVKAIANEVKEQISFQRELISLAIKRDSAQNN